MKQKQITWIYFKFSFAKYTIPLSLSKYFIKGYIVCLKNNVDIIHCRSYIPTFIGGMLKVITQKNLIFDMRGLWPEEIALSLRKGRSSLVFNFLNYLERININQSDSIVALTNNSKLYLEKI